VVPLLDRGERRRADRLFAETEALVGVAPVLLHADLGPGHLLCREGRLVGVIDWGDAVIGDAALDFAWLLDAHPRGRQILTAYSGSADDDFVARALFYHRLAPWYEADYGLLVGRRASVEAGLAGIRARLP
ncbi:MAG TPA: phosphotransferase, partial [Gaiellaceae bacterium]|nr:phosphotransferase [Gaiellaceae bacterium]